ncbi:hypothetical protein [Psychroserpens sp.]|uniref:hypothetical protein n=1 Tax=Psychroserpens sp. TaxID=2020870 RepID=UPI002B266583|nr:hypothetical protein [Psychroserpens sp.]
MKNIKMIFASFLVLAFMACDQEDANINTIYDGSQVGVGFTTTATSVVIPEEGITVTVNVQSTTTSDAARSYNVSVDESSTGMAADYSIGSLSIPAGSYDGTLDVTFGNFDNLPEAVSFELILNLDLPDGVSVVGSESTTFNYLKKLICNDVTLEIVEDAYADERNWMITDDSDGSIVVQCSDYADCPNGAPSGSIAAATYTYNFNLPDGCYTFTITDAFGDGLFDGNITGTYKLSCSIITHAAGEGNFGSEDVTPFCINL